MSRARTAIPCEFHKKLPQLHVALAWTEVSPGSKSRINVFDGQHKAAAQIFLGVRRLPIRVFIDPDADILLTANSHAALSVFGGKQNNSFWQEIFMTGRSPEGAEVMSGGMNLMNMISHGGARE